MDEYFSLAKQTAVFKTPLFMQKTPQSTKRNSSVKSIKKNVKQSDGSPGSPFKNSKLMDKSDYVKIQNLK